MIVTVLVFGYEYIYNMVISLRRLALRLYHRSVSGRFSVVEAPLIVLLDPTASREKVQVPVECLLSHVRSLQCCSLLGLGARFYEGERKRGLRSLIALL